MGGIRVNVNVGLRPNNERRAIVKTVQYFKPEKSTIGQEEINMETVDGLKTTSDGWFINNYCHVHYKEFCEMRDKILSGEIKEGTEVTVVYNSNGIMYFYL